KGRVFQRYSAFQRGESAAFGCLRPRIGSLFLLLNRFDSISPRNPRGICIALIVRDRAKSNLQRGYKNEVNYLVGVAILGDGLCEYRRLRRPSESRMQ